MTFPAVFRPEAKPLALGIGREIWIRAKAAGIGRKAFDDALGRRTNSPAYLEALAAAGAMRCDLEGRPVESVAAEHRQLAIEIMRTRSERVQARTSTRSIRRRRDISAIRRSFQI